MARLGEALSDGRMHNVAKRRKTDFGSRHVVEGGLNTSETVIRASKRFGTMPSASRQATIARSLGALLKSARDIMRKDKGHERKARQRSEVRIEMKSANRDL
jgi:hypothetical protein